MTPEQHEETEERLVELMAVGWLMQAAGENDPGPVPGHMLARIGGLVAFLGFRCYRNPFLAGEASRDLKDVEG